MGFNFSHMRRRLAQDAACWRRHCNPWLIKLRKRVTVAGSGAFRWISTILIGLLWVSFEGYTRAWKFLQPILEDISGRQLKNGHRALFCVIVSLIVGNSLLLRFTPNPLTFWSFLFWVIHGLAIHAYWDQGARWCRRRLGLRSTRYDPERPFDGLDLGN